MAVSLAWSWDAKKCPRRTEVAFLDVGYLSCFPQLFASFTTLPPWKGKESWPYKVNKKCKSKWKKQDSFEMGHKKSAFSKHCWALKLMWIRGSWFESPQQNDSWRLSDTWSARSPTAPKRPGRCRTTSYFAHNTTTSVLNTQWPWLEHAYQQKAWSHAKLHGVQNSAAKHTRTNCAASRCLAQKNLAVHVLQIIGKTGCKYQMKLPPLPHPFCNVFPRNWLMVATRSRLRVISRIGDIPWTVGSRIPI